MDALRGLDVYPKLQEEYQVRTAGGAVVSIVAVGVMLVLFMSELAFYSSTSVVDHLQVDTSRGAKLAIDFDIEFPEIPCSLASVDIMDVSGAQSLGVEHNVVKKPLDASGKETGGVLTAAPGHGKLKEHEVLATASTAPPDSGANTVVPGAKKPGDEGYCGSCFGSESTPEQCCNTCLEVQIAYRKKGWAFMSADTVEQCVAQGQAARADLAHKEGCRIQGQLLVNRVAGNFHFAPGHGFQNSHAHVHDLDAFTAGAFNVSHTIHKLGFGQAYPGHSNPLDGYARMTGPKSPGGHIFQYYLKVVPTSYTYLDGTVVATNQYSYTQHQTTVQAKQGHGLPGVFFFFDISPIKVGFEEHRRSFTHFLTQLCAIIGGVFTVAGIIDKTVYHSYRSLEKARLGKQG